MGLGCFPFFGVIDGELGKSGTFGGALRTRPTSIESKGVIPQLRLLNASLGPALL